MADEIDPGEMLRFQAQLLSELEKRGYLLTGFTEMGFGFVSTETGEKNEIRTSTYFKLYKSGKTISEIIEQITSIRKEMKTIEKADIENLFPIVKDADFMISYEKTLERMLGQLPPEHPAMPILFKNWKDHEVYILCGMDLGHSYRYLSLGDLNKMGLSHQELYAKMIDNLAKKTESAIKEKKVDHLKQAAGIHSLAFPDDLSPSFVLIAHRYFDYLEELTGIIGAEYFIAFVVTTEEILICGPSLPPEALKIVYGKVLARQEELKNQPQVHKIVSIEPIILTRQGMTFFKH
jgi:hypothetical protein